MPLQGSLRGNFLYFLYPRSPRAHSILPEEPYLLHLQRTWSLSCSTVHASNKFTEPEVNTGHLHSGAFWAWQTPSLPVSCVALHRKPQEGEPVSVLLFHMQPICVCCFLHVPCTSRLDSLFLISKPAPWSGWPLSSARVTASPSLLVPACFPPL